MLTVKNITRASMEDAPVTRLWEASEVTVQPDYDREGRDITVFALLPNGNTVQIDSGVTYIMNEAGKTVETVRLAKANLV